MYHGFAFAGGPAGVAFWLSSRLALPGSFDAHLSFLHLLGDAFRMAFLDVPELYSAHWLCLVAFSFFVEILLDPYYT